MRLSVGSCSSSPASSPSPWATSWWERSGSAERSPDEEHRSMTAWARLLSTSLRWLSTVIVLLTIAFLFLPVVVTVILSFSNQQVLQFPPREYGPRQYAAFLGRAYWTAAVG